MTRVKICGVTSVEDAQCAVELGASYLGLNFYPRSPRCLTIQRAEEIVRAVGGEVEIVAVLVDAPTSRIEKIMDEVAPDLLQFHGDETESQIEPWAQSALKVFRVGTELAAGPPEGFASAWGYLYDTRHDSLLGGSGESWDWSSLRRVRTDKPLFVAGGIKPENVRRAARESSAYAVDVCSSVESTPGKKDPKLLRQLFEELKR